MQLDRLVMPIYKWHYCIIEYVVLSYIKSQILYQKMIIDCFSKLSPYIIFLSRMDPDECFQVSSNIFAPSPFSKVVVSSAMESYLQLLGGHRGKCNVLQSLGSYLES